MRTSLALWCSCLLVGACGDDDGEAATIDAAAVDAAAADAPAIDAAVDAAVDAPGTPDARADARQASTVQVVSCAGAAIALTVTAVDFEYRFDGTTDLGQNAIVRFMMTSSHNAISGGLDAPDGQFEVDFSETKCLQFTAAGLFPFYCGPHSFTGSIRIRAPN